MAIGDAVKFGTLRTRDLVELFYGNRIVVSVIEKRFTPDSVSRLTLMTPDTRRISYEIVIINDGIVGHFTAVGTGAAIDQNRAENFAVLPGSSIIIRRNFITEMENVCLDVVALATSADIQYSTRETFLTPAPVDEIP
jgi:hypothetical protein